MACPDCQRWHLASELHGRDTAGGLARRDRLIAVRRSAPEVWPAAEWSAADEAFLAGSKAEKKAEVKLTPLVVRRKGVAGRPTGAIPWSDRKKAHLREYMRKWRAARRGE